MWVIECNILYFDIRVKWVIHNLMPFLVLGKLLGNSSQLFLFFIFLSSFFLFPETFFSYSFLLPWTSPSSSPSSSSPSSISLPLHRHHLSFISPRSDRHTAAINQQQHQSKPLELSFGFRELWSVEICELGIGAMRNEMECWFESWDPWAFKGLNGFEQKRKGFSFREMAFEFLGVNSGSWRIGIVEAARGRRHWSGA